MLINSIIIFITFINNKLNIIKWNKMLARVSEVVVRSPEGWWRRWQHFAANSSHHPVLSAYRGHESPVHPVQTQMQEVYTRGPGTWTTFGWTSYHPQGLTYPGCVVCQNSFMFSVYTSSLAAARQCEARYGDKWRVGTRGGEEVSINSDNWLYFMCFPRLSVMIQAHPWPLPFTK